MPHPGAHSLQDTEEGYERGSAPPTAPGCVPQGQEGRGRMSPGRCWGVIGRELKVKNSHGLWLLDIIFSPVWGHLRAISNSSGSSRLSFCTAMSAMGPRITTGRLKLAVGGQRCSGWMGQGQSSQHQAPSPAPHGAPRPAICPAPPRRGGPITICSRAAPGPTSPKWVKLSWCPPSFRTTLS